MCAAMEAVPNNVLEFLREQYPDGSRVQIRDEMTGGSGMLERIDDDGVFHVRMQNGSERDLTMGKDKFDVLPPEPVMLKLYMPMTAEIVDNDGSGFTRYDEDEEWENDAEIPLDGYDLVMYRDAVAGALEREKMPEEAERGIMRWYGKADGMDRKVHSAEFQVECREDQLWCVAECKVRGQLTEFELDTLKDYLSGQASDGIGESFEQHGIRVPDGEMYVHMWQSGRNWSIQTEQERFGILPEKGISQTGKHRENNKNHSQPAR